MSKCCATLCSKVMTEKRTKTRLYSWIFKNIRKNSWYFWTFRWDLLSCVVEIRIVGHSRNLKKFPEFKLGIVLNILRLLSRFPKKKIGKMDKKSFETANVRVISNYFWLLDVSVALNDANQLIKMLIFTEKCL